MRRFIVNRILLSVLTLIILSIIIFLGAQVLPGNVGRKILGPLADQASVDALNKQLGTNRSLVVQYWDWISGVFSGDLGHSAVQQRPVSAILGHAVANSGKLALLAFIIVVPLAVAGGVYAALNEGTARDRLISLGGLSATAIPDFVWAVVLIVVFPISFGLFKPVATAPPGSNFFDQVYYLLLPAICLVFVLFGYIARMARAGMIEALDSDYTRTAVRKGLSWHTVIRRHVLRNALTPTITVIATQTGYLIGGLVVVETLFRYQGIGSLILTAARGKDFPVLEGGILTIGIVYAFSTLVADLLHDHAGDRPEAGSADDQQQRSDRRVAARRAGDQRDAGEGEGHAEQPAPPQPVTIDDGGEDRGEGDLQLDGDGGGGDVEAADAEEEHAEMDHAQRDPQQEDHAALVPRPFEEGQQQRRDQEEAQRDEEDRRQLRQADLHDGEVEAPDQGHH